MCYKLNKSPPVHSIEGRDTKMFEMVLSGKSYEEIGSYYQLHPSRIRQIAKKVALDINRYKRARDKTIPILFTIDRELLLIEKELWTERLKEYKASLN